MMVYRAAYMRDQGQRNTWYASIAKGKYEQLITPSRREVSWMYNIHVSGIVSR